MKAGFDCNQARTDVEIMICSDAELSKADGILSAIYRDQLRTRDGEQAEALKEAQRLWIRKRDLCMRVVAPAAETKGCVKEHIDHRIGELLGG